MVSDISDYKLLRQQVPLEGSGCVVPVVDSRFCSLLPSTQVLYFPGNTCAAAVGKRGDFGVVIHFCVFSS